MATLTIALFCCFGLFPRVYSEPPLLESFGIGAAALTLFFLYVRASARSAGRTLVFEVLLNKVHIVQLVMQASIFTYWGFYWKEVGGHIPLILAQIAFVYALDMLVCWSRRDKWVLGFGPVPIVLSANLFLWFKDDWFWLQFLLISTGVIFKEYVRWNRDGRSVHIFNPSAIALFLFSLALIFTNSTGISWGAEIAGTTPRPPEIFLELFILGLVVQGLFSVTMVTLSCATVFLVFGLWFSHATGQYYFVDSNINGAVFLGMLLLVTDPATSPRRLTGKAIFGALYGVGVLVLYWILQANHQPQFYDKLLCVPLLNLMVRGLDRFSEKFAAAFHPLRLLDRLGPRGVNYLQMAMWSGIFVFMYSTGFLGRGLQQKMECEDDNAKACAEYGKLMIDAKAGPVSKIRAGESLGHACTMGLADSCEALAGMVRSGDGLSQLKDECMDGGE